MESKKESLQKQITEFIKTVLEAAERNGNLDHFTIEISNHQGNLQMDYTLRDRKKAY